MQEQHRRSAAASASVDRRTRGSDVELFESLEHGHEPLRASKDRPVRSQRAVRVEVGSLSCRWPARRPPAPACRRMIPPWSSTMRSTAAHRVLGSGPKQALDRRGPDPHWWARPPGCPGTGKLSSPLAPLTSSRQRQCPHFPLAARPARAGPVRRWLDAPLHQGDRLMTPAARHCRTMFAPPPIVMSLSPAAARAWPSADSSPSVTTL